MPSFNVYSSMFKECHCRIFLKDISFSVLIWYTVLVLFALCALRFCFYLRFAFTSWMSSYFSLNSLCSYHPLSLGKGDLLSWLTAAPRTSSAEELTDVPEQDTALSPGMTNQSKQAPVDETLE